MINEIEKAAIFLDSINKNAQERSDQIKRDVDNYVSSELQKTRAKAHEELKSLKKSEIDRLNEENNAGFSELEAQETRKLINRRSEITEAVFAEARKRLESFAKSAEYTDFLKASIKSVQEKIGADAVIFLKPDDKSLEAELGGLCREIRYSSEIEIGGCRAENTASGMIADDTLEARLGDEKESFYRCSGLSVTLDV